VSINLTDYETTPLYRVFEAVVREATARGVEIVGSELIGFVPRGAVEQTFAAALRLERFRAESVLENALDAKLEK
jgi:glutamate formiminotransferase